MGARLVALATACFAVAGGGAAGAALQQLQVSLLQLSPDCGCVYFHRTNSSFGAAIRPVKLDEVAMSNTAVPCLIDSQYPHV